MEVREEVRQLAEPLAEEHGYELVDIEQASLGHHRVIRIYLDKPGGVTVDDCARFSRHLADAIDMNQIVPRLVGAKFGVSQVAAGLLSAHWLMGDNTRLKLTANLSDQAAQPVDSGGTVIWGPELTASLPPWTVSWRIE